MTSDRSYPQRPVVGVGAVVAVADRDRDAIGAADSVPAPCGVVLIRRRFEPLAGEWSLPGGMVEVGETLGSAIAREVMEETGLTVEVGPVIEVFDRITLDAAERVQYHYVLVDYLCRPRGGRLQPGSDVSDAVIADPSALDPYGLTQKAVQVIRRGLELNRSCWDDAD